MCKWLRFLSILVAKMQEYGKYFTFLITILSYFKRPIEKPIHVYGTNCQCLTHLEPLKCSAFLCSSKPCSNHAGMIFQIILSGFLRAMIPAMQYCTIRYRIERTTPVRMTLNPVPRTTSITPFALISQIIVKM